MQRAVISPRFLSLPDVLILLLIGTAIYGLVAMGNEWRSDFHPLTYIDLSITALPRYTILSAARGIGAYILSLVFTLIVGYLAARNAKAEKFIIPMLDILQSIPVLGFLPGLVLGLIAIFPKTNVGLELAAVLMIFTGQVWNMTFAYYSSLKSIPTEFMEASSVIGLSWRERLVRLELPFSAVNLAWNSLMSMAGGWFFLSVCEAFTLGDNEFRLPGIGAYMAVAINQGNTRAMIYGIVAMVSLIVLMDFFFWRPVLDWVRRFRMEEVPGISQTEALMRVVIRESRIVRWLTVMYRQYQLDKRHELPPVEGSLLPEDSAVLPRPPRKVRAKPRWFTRGLELVFHLAMATLVAFALYRLFILLRGVSGMMWLMLARNTLWTLVRVFITLVLSSIWAVPVGIWIGTSQRRIQIAQPIIQVLASFPAPMLYPIALMVFFGVGLNFDWGSMFLMMLGVQWYVLFNVLAGALRIPQELKYALSLMNASKWERWRTLYLPSVFPALVTGWVTAAGGAWNASIVAEYISYRGKILETGGLGAMISIAAANQDFQLLAASLTVMVIVVLLLNRGLWGPLYRLAQTRFRMDQ